VAVQAACKVTPTRVMKLAKFKQWNMDSMWTVHSYEGDYNPLHDHGTKTPIGSAAGAVIGGVAASSIGDGKGAIIAGVLGTVAGGLLGSAAEEGLTKSQGVELVIHKQNSNNTISVVQAYEPNNQFHVGDRVRLMTINGEVRVSR